MKSRRILTALVCCFTALVMVSVAQAGDWPTWRHDAGRSASTSEQLPGELQLVWSRELGALHPAWPEDVRLQFDAHYEPIVIGKLLLVSSSRNDSVTAYDTESGKQRWQYFAEGPVRFAPVVSDGKVYFGADDGCLYCLELANGSLVWKFNAAPTPRRVIGNERLISVWPVRGGPVLADGKVRFTVGVWPFEGTLLYTVDAQTGKALEMETLKDLAPQGYLALSENKLFIPCGRANVHGVDLTTGASIRPKYSSKGSTDFHVSASGKWLFHGNKVVDVASNKMMELNAPRPVASEEMVYTAVKGVATAYDLKNQIEVEKKDRKGNTIKVRVPRKLWQLPGQSVSKIHLKAGQRLYAHSNKTILAIDLPADQSEPKVSWKAAIEGTPATMIVADGKLLVVTKEGTIHCYAAEAGNPTVHALATGPLEQGSPEIRKRAASILAQSAAEDGYCLALGITSGELVEEILQQSKFNVIAIDSDAKKVAALRSRFDARGLYGARVVAHVGDPLSVALPPYMAHLIISENPQAAGIDQTARFASQTFQALRPYGGVLCVEGPSFLTAVKESKLAGAELNQVGALAVLKRAGALPGAAEWTHEYGDPSNSLMSRDKLVKAPLGVLWFGGPSSDGSLYYDRHDWGPSLTVIEGRMFIQGPEKLTAVDIYTGRVLWQNPIPKGNSPGRRANWKPTGFHIIAVNDGVYMATESFCVQLDPATGKTVKEFKLPEEEDQWGRIRIWKNQMIVPVFRTVEGKEKERVPNQILAMDRHSGKVLWKKDAVSSFPMVAVGGDKVFLYEGALEGLYVGATKKRRLGIPVAEEFLSIKALNIKTGKEEWSRSTTRIASWLAYSDDHDVLLTANKTGISAWQGTDGDELWNHESVGRGFRGHPENYWGRVVLWKDRVLDQRGPGSAYDIRTGKPMMRTHPVTGKPSAWEFTKVGHHCNYAIASEHLMTFRAADAGFCDLATGATGRLSGFRSGCRNSLIPAGGVLNAPNFAYGCSCSYSIFTSLALVHVPESELWTYGAYTDGKGLVNRIGVNLGALGDRRSDEGTFWLEYPSISGPAMSHTPRMSAPKPKWFRLHSTQVSGDSLRWVASSGVEGIGSLTIPLWMGSALDEVPERSFTVRLYFAEPETQEPGSRVFDVQLQGKPAISGLDIAKEVGSRKSIVKEFKGIQASKELVVTLTSQKGEPILSGVELIEETE